MFDQEQKRAKHFGLSLSGAKMNFHMQEEEEKRGPGLIGQREATRRYAQTKVKPRGGMQDFLIDTNSDVDIIDQTENQSIAGIIGDVQIQDEQRSIRSSNQGSVLYGGSNNSRVNNQLETITPNPHFN